MKYELNKTWSTNLRLKTWVSNQKKWDEPKNNNTLPHRHQKGADYGDGTF